MSTTFTFRSVWSRAALASALGTALALALPAPVAAGPGADAPTYRVAGNYVEICSCERVCETALVGPGRVACAFVAAMRIDAGQRGDVPLGGLAIALVGGPERGGAQGGKPAAALYVDSRATPAQAEALVAIGQERFADRLSGPIAPPRGAAISIERSTSTVAIAIDGIADVRGKPLLGGYHRLVQLQNGPGMSFPVSFLARGAAGEVADPVVGVRFAADGRSVLYGKFDISNSRTSRKK